MVLAENIGLVRCSRLGSSVNQTSLGEMPSGEYVSTGYIKDWFFQKKKIELVVAKIMHFFLHLSANL